MDEQHIPTSTPWEFRATLRDLAPCSSFDTLSRAVGLLPAGPDVEEREHKASHRRMEALRPLSDEIMRHAHTAADVVYVILQKQAADADESEEDCDCEGDCEDEEQVEDCEAILAGRVLAGAACHAVIAQLVDKGLLVLDWDMLKELTS